VKQTTFSSTWEIFFLKGRALFLLFSALMITQCSRGRPANLGVTDGKLSPCPDSPNCVSSQSTDKKHEIEPLRYEDTLAEARDRLVSVLYSMGRSAVVTVQEDYIHAEFTSWLFRFVDDVEFYFDDDHKTIHLRSASRTGYSDLGVNRNRIERIRTRFVTSKRQEDN
jgi:uncharacterized protein (DUF1499 family)